MLKVELATGSLAMADNGVITCPLISAVKQGSTKWTGIDADLIALPVYPPYMASKTILLRPLTTTVLLGKTNALIFGLAGIVLSIQICVPETSCNVLASSTL